MKRRSDLDTFWEWPVLIDMKLIWPAMHWCILNDQVINQRTTCDSTFFHDSRLYARSVTSRVNSSHSASEIEVVDWMPAIHIKLCKIFPTIPLRLRHLVYFCVKRLLAPGLFYVVLEWAGFLVICRMRSKWMKEALFCFHFGDTQDSWRNIEFVINRSFIKNYID